MPEIEALERAYRAACGRAYALRKAYVSLCAEQGYCDTTYGADIRPDIAALRAMLNAADLAALNAEQAYHAEAHNQHLPRIIRLAYHHGR